MCVCMYVCMYVPIYLKATSNIPKPQRCDLSKQCNARRGTGTLRVGVRTCVRFIPTVYFRARVKRFETHDIKRFELHGYV